MAVEKIKPNAEIKFSFGNDGRDGGNYIAYSCPKCGKHIRENDIACDECGSFFDWSKRAHIRVIREVEWH